MFNQSAETKIIYNKNNRKLPLWVLKFLTYEQWFPLQFSNWRLANIVKKNVNYWPFQSSVKLPFM
jgi:hypothetical protein